MQICFPVHMSTHRIIVTVSIYAYISLQRLEPEPAHFSQAESWNNAPPVARPLTTSSKKCSASDSMSCMDLRQLLFCHHGDTASLKAFQIMSAAGSNKCSSEVFTKPDTGAQSTSNPLGLARLALITPPQLLDPGHAKRLSAEHVP